MEIKLAQETVANINRLDVPIGRLMEFVKEMEPGPRRDLLDEICKDLLHMQYRALRRLTREYPELDS